MLVSVTIHGEVLGEGTDSVASTATRKACEVGLQVLIKDPNYLSRTCNCHDFSKNQNAKAKGQKTARIRVREVSGSKE